jgi:DNA-binding transcriptional ArsR family regulator
VRNYLCRATAYGVLADAHRRQSLDLLRIRDRAGGELVDQLGLSQPGVSKHLRMLREAGLVTVRHDAQRRWYGLRAEPLVEIDDWLAPYRAFWSDRLDALERHLEENPE